MRRSIVEGRLDQWQLKKAAENGSVGSEGILAEPPQKN